MLVAALPLSGEDAQLKRIAELQVSIVFIFTEPNNWMSDSKIQNKTQRDI